MIENVLDFLVSAIARTTFCTTFAAAVALFLLPALGIRSPRVHRMVWIMVILQGWILVPLNFQISVPNEAQPQPVQSTLVEPSVSPATIPTRFIALDAYSLHWQRYCKQTACAAWLLGTLAISGFYLKRYYGLVTRVPLGSVPDSSDWENEWREVVDAVSTKESVRFRITNRVGPLLCFVPFTYLVLVPRLLWASLGRNDRIAILRHELAHLERGDLWKNVAIRLFALPQWFNPLAWIAVHRFEEAGEWACDEKVVAASELAGTSYAKILLRVAGFSVDSPCGAVAASGGVLARRVRRLIYSTDKEVSQMKNLVLPLLLLAVAVAQAVRIESVRAEESVEPAALETRAEEVARGRAEPYRFDPPDVVHIELKWEDINLHQDGMALKAKQVHADDDFLVGPDGSIVLMGSRLDVAGLTIEEVKHAIVDKFSEPFGVPQVSVDVAQANSKVVYLITHGGASGDNVTRIPHGDSPTVLDALKQSMALDDIDQVYVISRTGRTARTTDRLDVDLEAIQSTNFGLLPGDRVFVIPKSVSMENHAPTPVAVSTEKPQDGYYQAPAQPAVPAGASPYAPAPITPAINLDPKQVNLSFQVILDTNDSFAEIEGLRNGGPVISDSQSALGFIRVLLKNGLGQVLASPRIVTTLGRRASFQMSAPSSPVSEGLSLDVTPASRSEGVLMSTKFTMTRDGESLEHSMEPILQEGQTCIARLPAGRSEGAKSPRKYLVITRDNLR